LIGTTLSHFKITAKLGEGGMGEVYRAEDTELGREVAIKMLPAEMAADPDWLERFKREARALASINHPNIVTLYSIESAAPADRPMSSPEDPSPPNPISFLVMELVEGETLANSIPDTGMSMEEFWQVAIPLVEAIGAAHAMGITHRDLKPGNVIVGNNGRVKIFDFGIAKVEDTAEASVDSEESTWAMTRTGMVLGTIPYMSPEQLQGRKVDPRSDVFSLGSVLFETLSGERPFAGESSAELISTILRDDPDLPARLRSELPQGLYPVIRRCLEKNPNDRYPTASELQVDLEEARKGKLPVAAESVAPSIAVLPFVDMSLDKDQDYFCEGMAEEIIIAFTGIEGLRVASRTSSFRFKETDADIQSIGKQLHVSTVLEGSVRKAGNRLRVTAQLTNVSDGFHLWSKRYDRELEDVFAIQDEISQSIAEALKVELSGGEQLSLERAATTDVEAYEFFLRGRKFFYEGTRKGIELAVEMFHRATRRDPNYALAYAGLADCYSYLFMYFDKTPSNKEKAVEASRRAVELGDGFAETHATRGLALSLDQRYDEAAREFEAALELNASLFEAYYFYARVSRESGDLEKAARLFEKAVEVRRDDYQSHNCLATAYQDLDRPNAYRDSLLRARDTARRHVESYPHDARALYLGAGILVRLGEKEEGLEWGRRALELDPNDPRVLYNLACLYCESLLRQDPAAGDPILETAVDYFERAIAAGYASREWIDNDSDLDPVRDHPRFQAALATLD
jgi:serine/threonine protein kinase/Flp pilus assembly protein TadD